MLIAEGSLPPLERSSQIRQLFPVARPMPKILALHIHHRDDPMRALVESYIRQRYERCFGAHLREWLPTLVTVQANGEILAAAGYRDGSDSLFLERYLAAPIEHYLQNRGASVARNSIVEAGQFAAAQAGAGRILVPLLVRHLRQQGFDWAVSTLTDELHHLFSRMGLAHQPLSIATPDRLNEQERKDWGSYYAHAPRVYAGRLDAILEHFPEADV